MIKHSRLSCGMFEIMNEDSISMRPTPAATLKAVCESMWPTAALTSERIKASQDVEAQRVKTACRHCGRMDGVAYTNHDDVIGNNKGIAVFSHQDFRERLGPRAANWCFNLAEYIQDNKLGEVIRSKTIKNPNTSNPICSWIWFLDRVALNAWGVKNGARITAY